MTDTIDNTLAAVIRSMETVVLPSVDSTHPLATEQADLVVKTLRMLREQLPHRRAKALRELDRYVAMAEEILPLVEWSPTIARRLEEHLRSACRLRESVSADPHVINECVTDLAVSLSTAARGARIAGIGTRAALEQAVLAASRPIVDDDIAWFAPQGWSTSNSEQDSVGVAPKKAVLRDYPNCGGSGLG